MCQVERDSAGAMMRTGFWMAPRRQHQSIEDKFLLAYFLTCPERTSIGLYPIHLGEAAGRTGGDKHQFSTVMDRLVEQNEINAEGFWVLVRSWWDHNNKPGPGLREKITRTLAEAPPSLRSEWEAVATAAGVYPFRWADDEPGPTGGGTQGGTPGPTPPPAGSGTSGGTARGTRGNNNNNDNNKPNPTVKKKTTTTKRRAKTASSGSAPSDGGADAAVYASVSFPAAEAESHRPAFQRVCAELNLTTDEANDLALELCARIESAHDRPEFRIHQTEPWMRTVVTEARAAGASIIRAGAKYRQEAERSARRIGAALAESTAAERERERQEVIRLQHERDLQAIDDSDLVSIAQEAESYLPSSTSASVRQKLRAATAARILPSGLAMVALARALSRRAEGCGKDMEA